MLERIRFWRAYIARQTRIFFVTEAIKFFVLTIGAVLLGWFLTILNSLLRLKEPLTLKSLPDRVIELLALIWADPYRWTFGLFRFDPIRFWTWLFIATVFVVGWVLLRRARWRLKDQERYVKESSVYRQLVAEAGLGGRWPHARTDGTGAPWQDLREEILHPQNNVLDILGANGIDTFGGPDSPLFNTLAQFRGTTRIILVSPKSTEVIGRSNAVGMDPQVYKDAIDASVRRLRALKHQQHAIDGRFYDGQPNWKLIITARTAWMQYYMPGGMHVDQTPCWRFDLTQTDGALYHYFHMEFDRIWRRCQGNSMYLQ